MRFNQIWTFLESCREFSLVWPRLMIVDESWRKLSWEQTLNNYHPRLTQALRKRENSWWLVKHFEHVQILRVCDSFRLNEIESFNSCQLSSSFGSGLKLALNRFNTGLTLSLNIRICFLSHNRSCSRSRNSSREWPVTSYITCTHPTCWCSHWDRWRSSWGGGFWASGMLD